MANEISETYDFLLANGAVRIPFNPGRLLTDQTAQGVYIALPTVGLTESDMPIGDIVSPGVLIIHNLDSDNFVTYGPKRVSDSLMEPLARLKPSRWNKIELEPGATLRWIADTAPVKVQMILLEE